MEAPKDSKYKTTVQNLLIYKQAYLQKGFDCMERSNNDRELE